MSTFVILNFVLPPLKSVGSSWSDSSNTVSAFEAGEPGIIWDDLDLK